MEAPPLSSGLELVPRAAPEVLLGVADVSVRRELRVALEQAGLAVREALDLPACIASCERALPDLALVEIPSGAEGASLAVLSRRFAWLPVIALLHSADPEEIQRAFDCGAAGFVLHPADLPLIAQRIRFVLRNTGATAHARRLARRSEDAPALVEMDRLLADLRAALSRAKEEHRHVAVMALELERFRAVTASMTHDACEQLLADVARRLRVGVRGDDVLALQVGEDGDLSLARLRGDELCLLLRNVKEADDVAKVAQRIVDLMDEPFCIDGNDTYLEVRVGIATYPSDDLTAENLLKAAEKAAFCAKTDGGPKLLRYSAGMDARALKRLSLESALRRALEREELLLNYQPRVEVASGRIVGVEALVRWQHPELGRISPLEFVPLAEETGLIVPIGEWILETACAQNRRWQDAGIAPIRMAVNLSSVQFRQRGLYEMVTRILAATRLDPRWLELELTESLLMRDSESAVLILERFKSLGVHLSIDDFGTGYSSLSYLKRFPIDALKIDQSFVREMASSQSDAALVTAIILMGQSLHLRVVAEGVETRSQLGLLRVLRCDEVQGYLMSRPVSADEMTRLLQGPRLAAFAA